MPDVDPTQSEPQTIKADQTICVREFKVSFPLFRSPLFSSPQSFSPLNHSSLSSPANSEQRTYTHFMQHTYTTNVNALITHLLCGGSLPRLHFPRLCRSCSPT
ncbi:hypothetical protein FRC20_004611 [Serendipita sp. 405]|nr:hypothetical protein FRC20_004611 [Serendipita sp. 405]